MKNLNTQLKIYKEDNFCYINSSTEVHKVVEKYNKIVKKCKYLREFPSSPMVRTLYFHCHQPEVQCLVGVLLLLLLSRFSPVRLCASPQMAAHQAPQSLGFSRQEHWSGLPFPSPQGRFYESCTSRAFLERRVSHASLERHHPAYQELCLKYTTGNLGIFMAIFQTLIILFTSQILCHGYWI